VTHLQFETASVVRYIEDTFSLGRLGTGAVADARALPVSAGCLDPQARPRAFVPLSSALRPADFMREAPSDRPPDDD
jgi:hypothetical protein